MSKNIFCFCIAFLLTFGTGNNIYASSEKEGGEKLQPVAVMSSKPVKAVRFGGKVELRYEDPQSKIGTFRMYQFEPFVEADLNDNVTMKGQVTFGMEKTEVNDGWIQYKGLPVVKGSLKAGRFRWKSFGTPQGDEDRVSIDYSLLGKAFTSDRQVGLEYSRSVSIINLCVGVFNGSQIGDREAGEVDTASATAVKCVSDRSGNTDTNQNKDVAFRVTVEPVKGFQIGGSLLSGKLSPADLAKVNGYAASAYTSDKKTRVGGDITYKSNIFDLKTEYIQGKTSELKVNSWHTMGVLKGMFDKLDIYARYSQLVPDIDPNTVKSFTWSLYQTTAGAIWNFSGVSKLQAEYDFNREGRDNKTKNDILRLRWMTYF